MKGLILSGGKPRRVEPISSAGQAWLAAGYLASIAFYLAVATAMMQ